MFVNRWVRSAATLTNRSALLYRFRANSTSFLNMSMSAASVFDVAGDSNRDVLQITPRCAQRIVEVKPGGFLRLRVDGGGCSGFKYNFELAESVESDDHIFERDGAKVVVDNVSLEMVRGAKVDYVEEMISSSFQIIENPKSDSSCGCGASFSPKS